MPIALGIVLGGQQVAGDLLGKKTIVRRVAIEGLNHIIPITPRMRERGIAAETVVAVGFAIARDIQPMPPPAFAEMR